METALPTFDLLLGDALDMSVMYLYPFTGLSSWCDIHTLPCSHPHKKLPSVSVKREKQKQTNKKNHTKKQQQKT